MVDILHRVGVRSTSPDAVYAALTTVDGLAGWWTTDTSGSGGVGDVLAFRFETANGPDGFDMLVKELVPGARVLWEVVAGPPEWIGTHVGFDLQQVEGWTEVLFRHEGWAEPVEFMHHCSTKWATFLLSMKELVETGTGRPAPGDVKIDNWN